jgi:hypothetical protein
MATRASLGAFSQIPSATFLYLPIETWMRAAWETHRNTDDPAAGVEFNGAEASALAVAVEFYVTRRFAGAELDSGSVATMRGWSELADRTGTPEAAAAGRALVLSAADVRRLYEAAGFYVAELDVESYQAPELRERLTVLYPLRCQLEETLAAVPVADPLDSLQLQ